MDTGIAYFPTDDAVPPDALARMVEEHGHTALYFAEHTHIPADRSTPTPAGGELARRYSRTHDLFVALTAAAMATTRLRVGSGVCLVIERDPIITAKEVASVDQLSGGRLEFGVGAGWNREEMANHGTDPRVRMAVLHERMAAMREIWTEDEASFHGKYVDFERIWCWPKPLQRPHPPVLVGGSGPTVLDRVLEFGDVWMPTNALQELDRIRELRERADAIGRRVSVYACGVPSDPARLEVLRDAGVERAIHWVPSAGRARIEASMERFETAIAELNGE